MAISEELQYAQLDELYLDAKNPRLGRPEANAMLSQEQVLDRMRSWTLDELAASYLESGFWTHEALLVVEEELDGHPRLVVVSGNRRLAALICLRRALDGVLVSRRWRTVVENRNVPDVLFDRIPYVRFKSRQEIESYLGFHHVKGIKQWSLEEKAQFIAKLIDERGMDYGEVARKIGYKTSVVQRYYISYRLLLQMENHLEDFSIEDAAMRFSFLFHLLRIGGARKYLNIDLSSDAQAAKTPVPKTHLPKMECFARWVFGTDKQQPLFGTSHREEDFDTVLTSPEAVKYLEANENPNFDYAFQLAHGDEPEIVRSLNEAGFNIAISLNSVHRYKDSLEIQRAAERLAVDFNELLNRFPSLRSEFLKKV